MPLPCARRLMPNTAACRLMLLPDSRLLMPDSAARHLDGVRQRAEGGGGLGLFVFFATPQKKKNKKTPPATGAAF